MPPQHPPPPLETISYGAHPLQHIKLHVPAPPSPPTPNAAPLIIFIHGGAYRDPEQTATSTTTALFTYLHHLLPHSALASISYRLSPHPAHPATHATNTARHPDHVDDVAAALAALHAREPFQRWVLIGHSVGATMAFQVLRRMLAGEVELPLPGVVMGVEGIYDFADIVEERGGGVYREFVEGAGFVVAEGCEGLAEGVDGYKGIVVIAQSDDDELVGWRQAEGWKRRCERTIGVGGSVRVVKIQGGHDECLHRPGLAEVVGRYVAEVWGEV